MTWQDLWCEIFGDQPADPTSREVSVQEALALLITGEKTSWFEHYKPAARGSDLLQQLWLTGFGRLPQHEIEWFVSEFELPVPSEWREEIPFTYRCPDFACGFADQVIIIELKTERGSYQSRQMADYLKLARRKLPAAWTDIVLLGPHKPAASPAHDDRQRYAEMTWRDVPDLLRQSFLNDAIASKLTQFLRSDLAATDTIASQDVEPDAADEASAAAVFHAMRLAPLVFAAGNGDRIERGIDVVFATINDARRAQRIVRDALAAAGYAHCVTAWLWQPSSSGKPMTPAGRSTHRELRLAPVSP